MIYKWLQKRHASIRMCMLNTSIAHSFLPQLCTIVYMYMMENFLWVTSDCWKGTSKNLRIRFLIALFTVSCLSNQKSWLHHSGSGKWSFNLHMKLPIIMAYRQSTHGAYSLDKIGIKLLVPRAEEGGGDIQPLAVQRELQHLWATMHPLALNKEWFWLLCQLLVLCHLHSISLTDTASQEYLQTERGKELFKNGLTKKLQGH